MYRILVISLLFLCLAFATGGTAVGEEFEGWVYNADTTQPEQRGTVVGEVTDTSNVPLVTVNISLPQLDRGTTTDKEGKYYISGLPAGTYIIIFQLIGYATENQKVNVVAGQTTGLNVVLQSSVIELQTITVTGTPYTADPLTSAPDIDILGGREKLRQQSATLGETLENLPGVTNVGTGFHAGKPVVRGLTGNRIRVLTAGISMDYQQYGVRHWPNVDPLSAGRIEVVRGASSVLYGSDALGGAINVIPRRVPDALDGPSFIRGHITSHFHTNNKQFVGELGLEGAQGSLGWQGNLIRRTAGNITVPSVRTASESGNPSDPKFTGELDHTDFEQLNGSAAIGYRGRFGSLSAHYLRWGNEHNFLLPNGKGIGQNLENDVLQVKGIVPLGADWILEPTLSYIRNLRQSNKPGSTRDLLPDDIVINLLLQTYTGRLEVKHGKIGPFAGTIGGEVVYDDQDTRGSEPLTPSATMFNAAVFAFEEVTFDRFTLSLGARFDVRSQEAEANEVLRLPNPNEGETADVLEQGYTAFSGSVGGTYRVTESLTAAANIGRGFRAPSIFELHVDGQHGGVAAYQIGDPDLKEETSLSTDLSLRCRFPRLQAKATIYRNAIDNYIFLVDTGEEAPDDSGLPVLRTTQADAELLGVDVSLQAQVLPWLQLRGTFETVEGENRDTGDKLPLLPATNYRDEVRFTQQALAKLQNLSVSFGVRHSSAKKAAGRFEPFWQFDNMPFGTASTEAYTLFDLGFGCDYPMAGRLSSFDVGVKNLFDKEYRDFLDTYKGYALSPGRNVILKLSVPFGIVQY